MKSQAAFGLQLADQATNDRHRFGNKVRSRLLSPREAARLIRMPSEYPIPTKYNAYHLFGDGLAVPVVAWLEKTLLYPLTTPERL